MRVSEYYDLGRRQGTLDFVDVDTVNDIPVFLDPTAIRSLGDDWGLDCLQMLTTFFDSVLDAVRSHDSSRASRLLSNLREPNETHLGVSRGKSAGRGFGKQMGAEFAQKLEESEAARTGLIQDLEDTAFFIEGVDRDIISDVTTNIIRGPLISYTQQMATVFDIPLEEGVASGPVWNPGQQEWEEGWTELPVADGEKLLLVPKVIVRRAMHMSRAEYYRHFLVPVLQDEEEKTLNRQFAETLRGARVHVTKKQIQAKYGSTKRDVTRETLKRPSVYEHYRATKNEIPAQPLNHTEVAQAVATPLPDYEKLLQEMLAVPTGKKHANEYHSAAMALISALFYPSLSMPEKEDEIHEGRKRVDITYVNNAREGFFRYLTRHKIPSKYIFVECKNYSSEVSNPELDQLSSRFSSLRGKFGVLACRSFENKDLFLQRCKDTAIDRRGFVIALDDDDFTQLVQDVLSSINWKPSDPPPEEPEVRPAIEDYPLLHERLRNLHR